MLFEHAFKVSSHNSTVYLNRATAYVSVGNCQQAIEDYDQALKINPQ